MQKTFKTFFVFSDKENESTGNIMISFFLFEEDIRRRVSY